MPSIPSSRLGAARRALATLTRSVRKRLARNINLAPVESSRLIVLLHELGMPTDTPDEELYGRLPFWKDLLSFVPNARLKRVFTSEQLAKLAKRVDQAKEREGDEYKPPAFERFFYLTGAEEKQLNQLARILRGYEQTVERAYVDRSGPTPDVAGVSPALSSASGHLSPAPVGIGLGFARDAELDGSGQRLIDIEQGWTFDHVGIQSHAVQLLGGRIINEHRPHGTSVLGVVCALEVKPGDPVGIAPNVKSVGTVSFDDDNGRANALLAALFALDCGDTLLIEAQVQGFAKPGRLPLYAPIEVYYLDYVLIRLCTALGIVVVEAGGNGDYGNQGLDLDTYRDEQDQLVLTRGLRDSKAILVSAATSATPHTRVACAPFGERVDCYAWGDSIYTLNSTPSGDTSLTTTNFALTSGAAAIIAGVTLLVQQWAESKYRRVDGETMRRVLSDPALGTCPDAGEPAIGVMPDLQAILSASPLIFMYPLPCIQGQA